MKNLSKYIDELTTDNVDIEGDDADDDMPARDDVGKKLLVTMRNEDAAKFEQMRKHMMPLEGCLVTLKGLGVVMNDLDGTPTEKAMKVDGRRGRCLTWMKEEKKYVVETFDGLCVYVAEQQCTLYEPPSSEEKDGFDAAWPHGSFAQTGFAAKMGSVLQEKDYCVVQMFGGKAVMEEALDMSKKMYDFTKLPADIEEDYLGYHCDSKTAWVSPSAQPRGGQKRLAKEGERQGLVLQDYDDFSSYMGLRGLDALTRFDTSMTNIGALLWSIVPEFKDEQRFTVWGRTNAMLRSSISGSAERAALRKKMTMVTDEDIETHGGFVDKRRLCMLYMINSEGGELTLHKDDGDVVIPVTANKVVLFRHDLMGYTYRPKGESLAMQAWLLDVPDEVEQREDALRVITGPPEPPGRRVNIMGVQTRYPGLGADFDKYWNMLVAGADTQIQVPIQRWDIDVYYRAEHTIGFSMTCHGAHMTQDEVELFDNEFFGISAEEVQVMAPLQRIALEVGYGALYNAGHRREEMKGWGCGVFVGDSGSDWDQLCPTINALRPFGRSNAITCMRLSHLMGLTGPCHTSETACSSSLVAMGCAHMSMRTPVEGQDNPSICTGMKDAIVIGINTMVGPGTYISLSGPGMLTHKGRCFTFDQSADGYARGEGCGSIKLKTCDDDYESMGRVAMLVGSCVNQDGRSASMTAPHGPSQQDVIRNSMREGGLDPKTITIAECHGTGTALGDPIEVGALRGVMKDKRVAPFLKTSTKTNLGHMEAAAGMGGFIKCLAMLNFCAGAPNNHLVTLNPHLDVSGYPVVFETEIMDFGHNSGLTGVSSFGFGGTNARADVWGNAQKGHRKCVTGTVLKEKKILV